MSHYNEQYFTHQLSKSNTKIIWEYGRIFELAGIAPSGKVLDIGCGAGPGLRYLSTHGIEAVGVDIANYALKQARTLATGVQVVQADVSHTLPFATASFDIILMTELIEHLRNGRPLLFECSRVLRPGGYLVITTPNLWDIRRTIAPMLGGIWSGYSDPTHINLYTPTRLVDDMISARFDAIQWRTGIKPAYWLSSRKLNMRLSIPYPPYVGNGLLVVGRREP